MNYLDYPTFFEGIARAFALEPDFYEYFIRQGFDPNEWPNCRAKEIAVQFHTTAQNKSVSHAMLYFGSKVESFQESNLLRSPETLITAFHEFKMFGLYTDLGRAILSAPLRANEVLAAFKNSNSSGVIVKNLKEEIAQHIENEFRTDRSLEKIRRLQDWPILSSSIGGFNPGRVMLVVAGTGVGKTTLSINLILSAIKDLSVLFINMEMSFQDIFDRISLSGAGLTSYQWRNPNQIISEKASDFISSIYNKNDFLITNGRALTLEQISNEIYRKKESHNIGMVFVDYDQKIRTKYAGEEWQTVQKAIEELEEVAKATETCIIILAQGDDNNLPKASKRSMQSAATVLAFYQEGKDFVLEAKKNRFGPRGAKIHLECDFERFQIKELGPYIPKPQTAKDLYG